MAYRDYTIWNGCFIAITNNGHCVGGRMRDDENSIITRAAKANGIAVNDNSDIKAIGRNLIDDFGDGFSFLYGDFPIVLNPKDDTVHVYGSDNLQSVLREIADETGFVRKQEWTTLQFPTKLIKYLNEMQRFADPSLDIKRPKSRTTVYPADSVQRVLTSDGSISEDDVIEQKANDIKDCWDKSTVLISYADEPVVSISKILSQVVYDMYENKTTKDEIEKRVYTPVGPPRSYIVIDLSKVADANDAIDLWSDLFIIGDHKQDWLIFTGVESVKEDLLKDMLTFMMKREEYHPNELSDSEMVDFDKMKIAMIYREPENDKDPLPPFVRDRSLNTYIVQL